MAAYSNPTENRDGAKSKQLHLKVPQHN